MGDLKFGTVPLQDSAVEHRQYQVQNLVSYGVAGVRLGTACSGVANQNGDDDLAPKRGAFCGVRLFGLSYAGDTGESLFEAGFKRERLRDMHRAMNRG